MRFQWKTSVSNSFGALRRSLKGTPQSISNAGFNGKEKNETDYSNALQTYRYEGRECRFERRHLPGKCLPF